MYWWQKHTFHRGRGFVVRGFVVAGVLAWWVLSVPLHARTDGRTGGRASVGPRRYRERHRAPANIDRKPHGARPNSISPSLRSWGRLTNAIEYQSPTGRSVAARSLFDAGLSLNAVWQPRDVIDSSVTSFVFRLFADAEWARRGERSNIDCSRYWPQN